MGLLLGKALGKMGLGARGELSRAGRAPHPTAGPCRLRWGTLFLVASDGGIPSERWGCGQPRSEEGLRLLQEPSGGTHPASDPTRPAGPTVSVCLRSQPRAGWWAAAPRRVRLNGGHLGYSPSEEPRQRPGRGTEMLLIPKRSGRGLGEDEMPLCSDFQPWLPKACLIPSHGNPGPRFPEHFLNNGAGGPPTTRISRFILRPAKKHGQGQGGGLNI